MNTSVSNVTPKSIIQDVEVPQRLSLEIDSSKQATFTFDSDSKRLDEGTLHESVEEIKTDFDVHLT